MEHNVNTIMFHVALRCGLRLNIWGEDIFSMLRKTIPKKPVKKPTTRRSVKKSTTTQRKQTLKGYNTFGIKKHKKIDFGIWDFKGGDRFRVLIEIELRPVELYTPTPKGLVKNEEDNGVQFTASGELTYRNRFAAGGQCLDDIYKNTMLKFNPQFKEIYDLWSKYHLKHLDTTKDEKVIDRIMNLFQ